MAIFSHHSQWNYSSTITLYTLPTLIRTQNWIEKSAWSSDGYSSSFLDDLRFYSIKMVLARIWTMTLHLNVNVKIQICINGIYCENKFDLGKLNTNNVCVSPNQGYCIMNESQPMCKCITVRKYIVDSSTLIAIIVIASHMVLMIFLDCSRYFTNNQVLDRGQTQIKRLYYTP